MRSHTAMNIQIRHSRKRTVYCSYRSNMFILFISG